MKTYVLHRVSLMVPVLVGVSVVAFLIIHIAPGDPAQMMLGQDATPAALASLRAQLGLDQPLPAQYLRWLAGILEGNFGRSLWLQRPVLGEVLDRLQATLLLTITALALSAATGVVFGIIAAIHRSSVASGALAFLSLLGISIPVFWSGVMLIILFSLRLHWLPPAGMQAPGGGGTGDLAKHLVLPAVTLAAPAVAIIMRLTQTSLIDVLRHDYVRTAAAKGLARGATIVRHALKNALIPVVTITGVQFGTLLGGAVVTETVFGWPGVGSLMVQGVLNRDFPLVQGAVLIVAINFSLLNLAIDLCLGFLDPRVRYG